MRAASTDVKLSRISFEIDGSVARIELRNPPLNVIDVPMMEELARTIAQIEAQPVVSVIALTGAGMAFSAGVDVAAHTPDKVGQMIEKFNGVIRGLIATKKVTIVGVHGHSLGGGAELAMVCDFVFTTHETQWGFPEIELGCFPPVACTALAMLVGQKRAAELILTGRTINGREAAEIGLATRAVPEDELDTTIKDCVRQLLALSPAALAIAKKASYAWDSLHFDKGLARAEKVYLDELMQTSDAQEGLQAFMEKRKPKWTGS